MNYELAFKPRAAKDLDALPATQRRRIVAKIEALQTEIAAWSTRVNDKQRAVDWHFSIDKARVKLKRLYPKI